MIDDSATHERSAASALLQVFPLWRREYMDAVRAKYAHHFLERSFRIEDMLHDILRDKYVKALIGEDQIF
jgi:hypothetical protein